VKVLAVDTSAEVAAVAVMEESRLLGEYIINQKKTHSQKLMPMIKEVLDSLELKPGDIDLYAASSGPGSFTGLRIGVTTIKAMAYAANKPVVSVPTLDALAYNIPVPEVLICPVMDARNRQVYTALYSWEKGRLERLTEYMGIPVEELVGIIKQKNRKVMFNGDAVLLYRDFFSSELNGNCEVAPVGMLLQKASSVAQAALIKASEGLTENCFDMVPFYLRKSQAEREYEKRTGSAEGSKV
jgi:tRNA threonylcarbamoyladenosine biosynthesis protein TsaB